MDKSYVTIVVCPICGKDTGELLLDKRLKPSFNMHTVTPNPCDKCKNEYLSKGVMLINPETGALTVIKDNAFKRMFNIPIPKNKIAFAEQEIINKLSI